MTTIVGWWIACAPPSEVPLSNDAGYARTVEALTASIDAMTDLGTPDWTRHERLAQAHLAMAGLTGAYEPYDEALLELDRAFTESAPGSGPHETEARVLLSLHRVPEAREALDRAWRAPPWLDDVTEARLHLLDAQVAWASGALEDSVARVDASLAIRPTYEGFATRANHHWQFGRYAQAEADYVKAASHLRDDQRQAQAWVALQQGLMDLDRDRLEDALDDYLRADAWLGGWWLVHEHIAEVLVLTKADDQAEALYRDVVAQTEGPAFLDALAELVGPATDEGQALQSRATATWNGILERHPQAAAGHAIDHFVGIGDLDRATALAQRNVEARPMPESYATLAEVHGAAERWTDARSAAETALSTGVQTPALLDLAAEAHRALGDRPTARAYAQRAADLRGD